MKKILKNSKKNTKIEKITPFNTFFYCKMYNEEKEKEKSENPPGIER